MEDTLVVKPPLVGHFGFLTSLRKSFPMGNGIPSPGHLTTSQTKVMCARHLDPRHGVSLSGKQRHYVSLFIFISHGPCLYNMGAVIASGKAGSCGGGEQIK